MNLDVKKIDLEYNSIMIAEGQNQLNMAMPDFDWLEKKHGKLGNYLHLQTNQYTKEEKEEFVIFLFDTFTNLKKYTYPRFSIVDLTKNSKHIFEKYLKDKINQEQMKKMVEIATIPRHMQNK